MTVIPIIHIRKTRFRVIIISVVSNFTLNYPSLSYFEFGCKLKVHLNLLFTSLTSCPHSAYGHFLPFLTCTPPVSDTNTLRMVRGRTTAMHNSRGHQSWSLILGLRVYELETLSLLAGLFPGCVFWCWPFWWFQQSTSWQDYGGKQRADASWA